MSDFNGQIGQCNSYGEEHNIQIFKNIYSNSKAQIRRTTGEEFPVERGVRQGDPVSPKLFSTTLEMRWEKEQRETTKMLERRFKEKCWSRMDENCEEFRFLTKLHLMDYSLLLGVHECGRGEAEAEAARQREAELDSERDSDSDSDTDNRHHGERWGWNTPPDSPRGLARESSLRYEGIIPELDIYAIPSQEGAAKKEIYFVALIDVLTHYGVKKQIESTNSLCRLISFDDKIQGGEGGQDGQVRQQCGRDLDLRPRAIWQAVHRVCGQGHRRQLSARRVAVRPAAAPHCSRPATWQSVISTAHRSKSSRVRRKSAAGRTKVCL
ncbi:Phosphatidylinositol 5-phosphate 4-kinase type-2 beta [Eumeta japonica]|uniref:Phosphatidylinositol 5-phosphate 4-kinase type-2 beta n=1 Tax=Eumeta variegata TaxID=151549 RepID=A0A4C1SXN4_EUMVA|nr:Phosphatidylinositol 5-phosphate 4-kinase type-2 beta [Eumeta japonica]